MGWRATRIGLDRPVILRQQFRAMVRAAAGETLAVMFPFIAEVAEFDAMKSLLQKEIARARDEGITPPRDIQFGTMLEIPSLLFQLPEHQIGADPVGWVRGRPSGLRRERSMIRDCARRATPSRLLRLPGNSSIWF